MMSAHTLPFRLPADVERAVDVAAAHLREGRLLAYPTETVYGLGGGVPRAAVDALVALKGRPAAKPFLLLVAGYDMLAQVTLRLTPAAAALAGRFWPGPLTLIVDGGDAQVHEALRGPDGGVAVRWTSHPGVLRLLQAYGAPITSTSANHPGAPAALSVTQIVRDWHDEIARGAIRVLDGGPLSPSPPSTVVDCMGAHPRVVRQGAISAAALRAVAPDLTGSATSHP